MTADNASAGPGKSAGPAFLAACENCAAWRASKEADAKPLPDGGFCARGLTPPPGDPRCEAYAMSEKFHAMLVARLMPEPSAIPIPLPGKAARDARRARR